MSSPIYPTSMKEVSRAYASMNEKVGIVMRTKDRPLLLYRALQSVLSQSYKNWKLYLVNDGGDATIVSSVLEKVQTEFDSEGRFQLIHLGESKGMEAASNWGLKFAKQECEYLAVHDDDDSWHPKFLEVTTEFLKNKSEYAGVVCHKEIINEEIVGNEIVEKSRQPGFVPPCVTFLRMAEANQFPPICLLSRMSVVEKIGMFTEELPVAGDWDYHLRLLLEGDIGIIPEVFAYYHHRKSSEKPEVEEQHQNSVIADASLHEHYADMLHNSAFRKLLKQNPGWISVLHYMSRLQYRLENRFQYYDRSFVALQESLRPVFNKQSGALEEVQRQINSLTQLVRTQKQEAPKSIPEVSQKLCKNLIIVGYEPTEGYNYRVLYYVEAARSLGITVTYFLAQDTDLYIRELCKAEVIILWRTQWDNNIERVVDIARNNKAKVVFDVDDLIFDPTFAHAKYMDGIRTQGLNEAWIVDYFTAVGKTMQAADFCTGSTLELVDHYKRLGKEALVTSNGFNEQTYQMSRLSVKYVKETLNDGLFRIGYASGTKTHQKDFPQCSSSIARVLKENPHCRLVLFKTADGLQMLDTEEFPEFSGLESQIEWRERVPLKDLPKELARFDLNIAPLEVGNPFVEAKSELKYFEASLVDVVTIASPTGPYKRAILQAETGFLAKDLEEWYSTIVMLMNNPRERARVAQNSLVDVLDNYGIEYRKKALAELFRRLGVGEDDQL